MDKKLNRRSFIKSGLAIGAVPFVGDHIFGGDPNTGISEKPDIAVGEGMNYLKTTKAAVDALGGMGQYVKPGNKVAILANVQRNNPGTFTKPEILRAIIQMCKEADAGAIHCLSWLPEKNWQSTGLKDIIEAEGAQLVIANSRDETLFRPVPVPLGKALKEARILKSFFDSDVFINLPITKDHAGNKFTGTLKNLMGLNSPQNNRTFHKEDWTTNPDSIVHLDQCIADLNTIITPKLCVVDATEFITTNGPFGPGKLATPRQVVVGIDRVAVDSYCCRLWGLEPEDIIMIERAHRHGLGEIDLSRKKIRRVTVS